MTSTGTGEASGLAGVDPRFLKRLTGRQKRRHWLPPSSQRPLIAAASVARFAAGILARLESPGILHHGFSLDGRRLIPQLASAELEDLVPDSVEPRRPLAFVADRATRPAIHPVRLGTPPIAVSSVGPVAPPAEPAAAERRPGMTFARPSAVGRLNRSLLAACGPAAHESSAAEPPAPAVARPDAVRKIATLDVAADDALAPETPAYPSSKRGVNRGSETGFTAPRGEEQLFTAPLPRSQVTGLARLENQARQSSPRVLNESTRADLVSFLGIEGSQAELHDNPPADELARSLGADAVTSGTHVYFRRGQFQPSHPRGLALIGHELTHVHAARSGVARQHGSGAAAAAEERAAVGNELRVLREIGWPARPTARADQIAPSPVPAGVKLGATDRLENVKPGEVALSERQLAELKEMFYRDLMDRLRIDHERGA